MFCSPQALLLGTVHPTCATLQCKPGPALQKAPTPHQLIPAPPAQGSAACLGCTLEKSRDGNGRQHWVISDSPVAYWKLLPNIPCHCTAGSSPGWHSCHSVCHPKGMGTLGTLIIPELLSCFGFHSDGSALKCQRDWFSTCIS